MRQHAQLKPPPQGTKQEPTQERGAESAVSNLPRQNLQKRRLPPGPHEQEAPGREDGAGDRSSPGQACGQFKNWTKLILV